MVNGLIEADDDKSIFGRRKHYKLHKLSIVATIEGHWSSDTSESRALYTVWFPSRAHPVSSAESNELFTRESINDKSTREL